VLLGHPVKPVGHLTEASLSEFAALLCHFCSIVMLS
jgi:hypothetical protein